MTKKHLNNPAIIDDFILKYDRNLQEIINKIRKILLDTDTEIGEHIKWNSPSFFYTGAMQSFDAKEYKRDIVVLNLHRGNVLMVLPTGARLTDTTGVLEGNYTDGRRLIRIADMKDLLKKEDAIKSLIKQWLSLVEK